MDIDEVEICTQEEDKCVLEVVKGILILDRNKKPIKSHDISKLLTKKIGRKRWASVMKSAEEKLKELGYNLVRLRNSHNDYILTSCISPLPSMYKHATENEVADLTLLTLVLAFIFMKDGPVTNDDLFNHLHKLNIYDEKSPVHKYFGDVKKKILTDFTSQLYLEKKIIEKESETFEIMWGERAQAEVSKKSFLEFVCKIGFDGKIEPKDLTSQYKAAMQEEEEMEKNTQGEQMVVE